MAKVSVNKTYNYNYTVRDHLARHEKVRGEIGIEIECEGKNFPGREHLDKYWTTHADGSLRGESVEYVMAGPVVREEVIPALNYLDELFKLNKTKVKDSYRTSVHVHVNMQSVSICQTYSTVLMYGILEDILTEYAGTTRVGNLFCLRMSDAEFMLHELRQGAETDRYEHLNNNGLRYAGCNVKSLFDHNSLEFRAFRGTSDMKLIAEWVDIILQIKDAALTYANPSEMLQNFSNLGPEGFIDKNFSKYLCSLIRKYPKWQDRIFAGVRLVQDVAYANDWVVTPDKIASTGKTKKMAYYGMENAEAARGEMGAMDPFMNMLRAQQEVAAARPVRLADLVVPPAFQGRPGRVNRFMVPQAEAVGQEQEWPAQRDEEL